MCNWIQFVKNVKDEQKVVFVQWVLVKSGNYYNEVGLQWKVIDKDQWLISFLLLGKVYDVNMDCEVIVGGYMMFINS